MSFQGNSFQNNAFQIGGAAGGCLTPTINGSSKFTSGSPSASHNVTLPGSISAGDRLVLTVSTLGTAEITTPTGWVLLSYNIAGTRRVANYWRDADGAEGATVTVGLGASVNIVAYVTKVQVNTFDPYVAPAITSEALSSTTTPDPGSYTAPWSGETLFINRLAQNSAGITVTLVSAYPANMTLGNDTAQNATPSDVIATASAGSATSTLNPDSYTFSVTAAWRSFTIGIKGYCDPVETSYASRHDGNETVMILHEQDQHVDHLGTEVVAPSIPSADPVLLGTGDGLDFQDFTDTADYGSVTQRSIPDRQEGSCYYPSVKGTATYDAANASSHAYPIPSGAEAGDRLVIISSGNTVNATFPDAGWQYIGNRISGSGNYAAYKDLDGTEGATFTVTYTTVVAGIACIFLIARGTFDPDVAPSSSTVATGTSTSPDPGVVTPSWELAEPTLWIASAQYTEPDDNFDGFPSNCPDNRIQTAHVASNTVAAAATAYSAASSFDPTSFSAVSSITWSARTVAVKGICGLASWQDYQTPDESYGFDPEDYGYVAPPVSEDGTPPAEDFLLGCDGLDTQDFTDEADYGAFVGPAIPDNNPDVAPSSLDDQDFTDTADYGLVVPQAIPDNNPDVSPAAVALDDQDFTDLADYGYTQAAAPDLDEQDPDLAQVDCDSQDFTDFEDYSLVVAPLSDDNNPEIAPSSLDDQDFTDHWDYSDYVLQLSDDFVLREDFILGDGAGLDTQDFTDLEDYGSVTAPLSDDSVDFLLGTGDGLDVQDFTDQADYGSVTPQAIPDNNPEIAPSDLDTQDFTDLADYGSVTLQAVPDNNPVIAPSDLDTQDFTDTADYGSVTPQAIPDNNPDVAPSSLDDQDFTDLADYGDVVQQAIEDNNPEIAPSSLDDQDFTDLADYGSFTPQANDEFIPPEDFILGDCKGLDTQDFTDFTDYGFINVQPFGDVTNVVVNGVQITVALGCFHVYGFGGIPDPTTIWTTSGSASTSWGQIADPTTVWTPSSDGSTSWSGITDPANPGWTKDC